MHVSDFLPMIIDRAHKEVLFFASPFFEAALSGNWSETGPGRPPSMSSVITISQPPSVPGDRTRPMTDISTEMTFAPMDPDLDSPELDIFTGSEAPANLNEDRDSQNTWTSESDVVTPLPDQVARARDNSLAKLQGSDEKGEGIRQRKRVSLEPSRPERPRLMHGPDAVIVLKEERVCPAC